MRMRYKWVLLFGMFTLIACKKDTGNGLTPVNTNQYFPPISSATWETVTPESLGWNVASIPALYDYLRVTQTRAFIVTQNGRIVLEQYFDRNITTTGPFDQNSQWYWASAGKTLTGFMVGKAQEEKLLSIDQKTATYLGEGWTSLPRAKENLITVKNQLTMTTGLDDGIPNNDNSSPANLIYKADAGTRWAYHNAPYTLLQDVVSKAVKQPFERYFVDKLASKIGMDGQWRRIDDNDVYFSTARGMARFGLLMANEANWDGQPILNDAAYYTASLTTSQNLNNSYGYLWWLNGKSSYRLPTTQTVFPGFISPDAPADMVAAMGKNGQLLNIIRSKKIVVIRMGDSPDNSQVAPTYQNEIWKRLNAVVK
jgi:CubicO group peptidase (beta-lactamase class C family)